MTLPSLLEQIDRLFDELVRDPWGRPKPGSRAETSHIDVEIPIGGAGRGDVRVAVQDGRLTVTVDAPGGSKAPPIERTVPLPPHSEVSSIETRFGADGLRIRVWLRPAKR